MVRRRARLLGKLRARGSDVGESRRNHGESLGYALGIYIYFWSYLKTPSQSLHLTLSRRLRIAPQWGGLTTSLAFSCRYPALAISLAAETGGYHRLR